MNVKMGRRVTVAVFGVTITVCLAIFVVGLVFITQQKECSDASAHVSSNHNMEDQCKYSVQAKQSGLIDFLDKVQRTYLEIHPDALGFYSHLTSVGSKPKHHGTYLTPGNIKNVSDSAQGLLVELNNLNIDVARLKPREQKALAEVRHVLEHTFAQPYDWDYYSGDWMLGPNNFCTQYICKLPDHIVSGVASIHYRPKNIEDIWLIRDILAEYNKTIYQYMDNMRLGVRRGMVRSIEECLAGLDAVKGRYLNIVRMNATGILDEWFVYYMLSPRYLAKLDDARLTQAKWKEENGKSLNESIRDYVVKYLGEPLHAFIRFLGNENLHYCVPSNISSGLASLPLDYVYYKGKKTDEKTTNVLPTGENINGKKAYSKMLSFYTTTNITAEEVHRLGWKQIHSLYSQVVDIAKNITGELNESLAIASFKVLINDRSQFFNKYPFPKNESNADAKEKCRGLRDAEIFCPKRWAALQLWYEEARKIMSQIDPETYHLFYFTGTKHTTPNCPIIMEPNFNPSIAAQSYLPSNSVCSRPARYRLPFFNDHYGPRYQDITINAHEARPGHHTQVQGFYENFKVDCPSDSLTWLDKLTGYYRWFSEGWAVYAENPLVAKETDVYRNKPLKKFGMLKGQMWRALRLVVDTGLHYMGMKRDEALKLLAEFALDSSDVAEKEVTRYQSTPGQATSYMIGQHYFLNLRNYTKEHLGKKMNMREFHYQVLRHGSAPLSYIKDQVKHFVECKKDKNSADCKYLLDNSSKNLRQRRDSEEENEELLDIYNLSDTERYY